MAFSQHIHERLLEATRTARRQAEEEIGASLVPILADRFDQLDETVKAMFPQLGTKVGPRITNESGWQAGRIAAEMATLGPEAFRLRGGAET